MKGMWRPTKEEIREWLNTKEIDFVLDHNQNPWMNAKEWLQRYAFIDLHEIFFIDFLNVLAEWILRFVEHIGGYRIDILRNWTSKLIQKLNYIRNKVSRAV
jgi:hypothetical protein